jgi:putative nucleotidyltransferase with HDIG domain
MFTSLFTKKRPSTPSTRLPSSNLKDVVLRQLAPKGIPALPGNARIMFELATNPQAELKDILPLIKKDESMTARIIKVANSAYFNRGKPVPNITDAVGVIGLQELCSLLSCASLSDIFPSSAPIRATLWTHNTTTAIIARTIAQQYRSGDPATAFTAGLLHDIGKLLIIQKFPREYTAIHESFLNRATSSTALEKDEFPFDHTDVGYFIGEKWKFPAAILNPIVRHHLNWEDLSGDTLTRVVKLADMLAHEVTTPKVSSDLREKRLAELKKAFGTFGIKEDPTTIVSQMSNQVRDELDMYA